MRSPLEKIKRLEEIAKIASDLRAQGKRIVFTNGCFDILHRGHAECLLHAKRLGDVLIVGVNSDESVRQLKGEGRPILGEETRAFLVASLCFVDFVFIFNELRPHKAISLIKPDAHVKGGDYSEEELPEATLVKAYGGQIHIVPLVESESTTQIIERVKQGVSAIDAERRREVRAVGIIPARYGSKRFEGKVIAKIAGKPMIQHVYERALRSKKLSKVIIATDDERVANVARGFGADVRMTSKAHQSGTDRVAEVASGLDFDVIVNIQGDEPLLDPNAIDSAVEPFERDAKLQMTTLATKIKSVEDYIDPNVVKVVVDLQRRALYFSRSPIPFFRPNGSLPHSPKFELPDGASVLRHIGLYAFRRDFLLEFASWHRTPLELAEGLEQLRALEHGASILVVETDYEAIGVDTPEDLEKVEKILLGQTKPQ
ncbi:MAG: hypothetical protein HZRFUVUK_001087 [Candidatus Fervidibacterota bacterium]